MKSFKNIRAAGAALAALALAGGAAKAEVFSLDSCRALALDHNKQLMISAERVKKASFQKKEACAAYLPAFDFQGAYFYNQKGLSILSEDQHLPVQNFNLQTQKYEFSVVKNPVTGEPVKGPGGQFIPEQTALLPKEALEYDIHNVFFGAVTLTQPIFMGGKIVAMNRLTGYAEQIARQQQLAEARDVVYAVDAAYWTVVSLRAKHELATSYISLLDSLTRNVRLMLDQGVATRSDLLSVEVRLNEAEVDLLKVENGLALSRMALAQICGLPVNSPMEVADEGPLDSDASEIVPRTYDMESVYANRPELEALRLAGHAAEQQARVARADMLPQVALMGMYSFSNPNLFDGFRKRFDGAFSVGVMLKVPIWHWGGNYNKYRAAKTDRAIRELQLQDAKEMVNLQVSQADFKVREALKTHAATRSNLAKAEENLRTTQIGFKEGVLTADDVLGAQTAWLKANSEDIDAGIEVRLCETYLAKSLGTLKY